MKVHIYSIYSPLHNKEFMKEKINELLKTLKCLTSYEYEMVPLYRLYDSDLSLILVSTGGSEGYFKKVENKLKEPIYLLTFGNDNSLAASLEILTYIQSKNMRGEILHGTSPYISNRIQELMEKKNG